MKVFLPVFIFVLLHASAFAGRFQDTLDYPYQKMPAVYPGTKPLTWTGDLSARMLDGAHRLIEEKIRLAAGDRAQYWKRDLSSAAN